MHDLIHAFLWLQGWLSVGYLCQVREGMAAPCRLGAMGLFMYGGGAVMA